MLFYASSRTKPKVLHVIPKRRTSREGAPRLLQPVPCGEIPRRKSSNFAPMGLVRRIVEMLLQAGISSRVGRNDKEQSLLKFRRKERRVFAQHGRI